MRDKSVPFPPQTVTSESKQYPNKSLYSGHANRIVAAGLTLSSRFGWLGKLCRIIQSTLR